ncbi:MULTISPECIES: MFS transporter [unclassified Sphingomonas]|uniref:MFS transporter n=1 Tax=unclassified Sphingomonas TaxID=196159 RepID=UPI000A51EF13|nr:MULTISPECIES: MFS transporter [unclassified Sphingomonas]
MAGTSRGTGDERPGLLAVAMSPYQYLVVALCCFCNVADGFDVVSLALAAPVLTREWGVAPAVLGTIFGVSSVGLSIGAFVVAPFADKIGRRPVMLAAIGSLAAALLLTSIAGNVYELLVLRFVTGIGLGTLVVCLNTTVAEVTTYKVRNISLAILHLGFTIGTMTASGIAVLALEFSGWRTIFVAAGILNAITFAASLVLLGESPDFLAKRRKAGDLAKLNRLLARARKAPLADFPPLPVERAERGSIKALLAPDLRRATILVWVASLTYAIVGYFLLNWKPTILANAGLSPTLAAASGMITGACGALGHLTMGLFARRIGEGRLTAIYFALAAVSLVIFGIQPPDPVPLLAMAGVTTLFVVGAYTGLFLVAVKMYPSDVQNTGVGFVVGFGRVGAIIGPMIGGFLVGAGLDRMDTYFVFSVIAVVPAVTMHLANRLAARQSPHRLQSGDQDAASPAV